MRKCGRRAGYHHAGRRDVRREAAPRTGADETVASRELLGREPRPDEAAVLADTLEHLLAPLHPRGRQIIVLSLQRHDSAEIAAQTGCTQRTVQRVLQRLRCRLERQQLEEAERSDDGGRQND